MFHCQVNISNTVRYSIKNVQPSFKLRIRRKQATKEQCSWKILPRQTEQDHAHTRRAGLLIERPGDVVLQAEIITELADGTLIGLVQYNIPTRPGWSRMLNRQVRPVASGKGSSRNEASRTFCVQGSVLGDLRVVLRLFDLRAA